MDDAILEELLNEDESSSLDFKREQYRFQGASEADKAELLKDVLAFANAWRRAAAYILIGVEEVRGGRSTPLGITDQLNDHDLQQFVNRKTNQPVAFQYSAYPFQGVQLGIIEIPLQDRPVYLVKGYGGLTPETVYIRRGSSTDTARPDEVARMGAASVAAQQIATLVVGWGEPETRKLLGPVTAIAVEVLDPPLPAAVADPPRLFPTALGGMRERGYGAKKVQYVFERGLHRPLYLVCRNTGRVAADKVVVSGAVPRSEGLRLAEYPPDPPHESYLTTPNYHIRPVIAKAVPHVDEHANHWTVRVEFDAVLPGETKWSSQPIYLGADRMMRIELPLAVMAANIPEPVLQPLAVEVVVTKRPMAPTDLDTPRDDY